MQNYIITISREFGCGAQDIAIKLASELGAKFYDKNLVDLVANDMKVNANFIKESDEIVPSKKLFAQFSYGTSTAFYSEAAIQSQAKVIREIADKGENCILFGRCSDYILREYPNVIKFFLYAPLEMRINHIHEKFGLDKSEALKLIKRVDKQRHNYYKYVTGQNRGDRYGKDLMIDVETFGTEGAVEMMKQAVLYKFDL